MTRMFYMIAVLVLVGVGVSLTSGCGSGSQRSEVNTQTIEPIKPGQTPDMRDQFLGKGNKPKG